MSLLRQLLLSVTVAIIAILVGTLLLSVNAARDYLNTQLQSESDNAASSLALSLSQPSNQDPVLRELLITALFDSGQFQAIELRDSQGNELVSRRMQRPASVSAPDWFSQWLPLRAPQATRHVSDGWTQVGDLTVVADDSAAKSALWDSSVRVLGWVVLAGALWLIFVVLLTRWLKRALHAEITQQVDSLADGQAVAPGKVHKQIADLLPSSTVMVQARERIQASKQEAAERIESLTVELNHDAITGVPNRRYFMNELRRALQGTDEGAGKLQGSADAAGTLQGGYVMLSRQRDLGAMAAALPRDQVDAWLRGVGDRLQQVLAEYTDASMHVGRLNGSDFAVLIPGVQGPAAMLVAQAVQRTLLDARIPIESGRQCRWAFAMTDYATSDDVSRIFTRLDTAMMAAESAGHSDVETLLSAQFGEGAPYRVVSETAWRSLLLNALSENRVGLAVRPANYGKKRPGQNRNESTLTITDPSHNKGESLSGFSFMPAAVRLGLSAQLDARAIKLAIAWLEENAGELVVRVSVPSLLKSDFLETLKKVLDSAGTSDANGPESRTVAVHLRRLTIEVDAYGLAAYPAEVATLCQIANDAGVRVGLRGVAQQLDAVARLQGLRVAYIKLAGGFIADLETSQGAVSLLNAVIHTAMALGISVLVDDAPSDMAALLLRDHGAMLPT